MSYQISETPEQRKSMPSRGIETSTVIWMKEKKQRDQQLWNPQQKDLWIVENKVYDLREFSSKHPGGQSWIKLTKGQDITEHFIVHHLRQEKAREILNKYYVGECKNTISRLTFKENGLYRTLKKRVLKKFTVQELQDQSVSKKYAFILLFAWIAIMFMTIYCHSYILALLCAPMMIGILGIGHNFVHHKDNLFSYIFLFTGFTPREWKIMHCISHHLYPNTGLDYQFAAFQPIAYFARNSPQNNLAKIIILELLFCFLQPVNMTLKLFIIPILKKTSPDYQYSFPLLILTAAILTSDTVLEGFKLYLLIYGFFTFMLMKLLFCGHRIQDTWTEGCEKIEDYAEHTISSTSDTDVWIRGIWSYILLAGFNIHVSHHLFPTCDHHILPEVDKQVDILCRERGIKRNRKSRFECLESIYKGMFKRVPFVVK